MSQIAIFPGDPDTPIMIRYKITLLWLIAGHLRDFLRDLIGDSKDLTSESQRPDILIHILGDAIDRIASWTLAVRALDFMQSALVVTHQPAVYSEPNHTPMVLKQRCHISTWQATSSRQQ